LTVALFTTIWAAVALFVAGEVAKTPVPGRLREGAWKAWALGLALCAIHMALAMSVRYAWHHEAAVRETAAQAAAVFGVTWQGGLYVNYLFLIVWGWDTAWWARSPASYAARPSWQTRTLRTFYFVILFNATVVFASVRGRVAGIALMAILLAVWAATPAGSEPRLLRGS
jgi:hypothetical protein